MYVDEIFEQVVVVVERCYDLDYFDSEGKNSLYFIYKMEYEVMQLWKVYKVILRQLWLGCLQGEEILMEVNFYYVVL